MRLVAIEIENYKSFHERQKLEFEPGFNLLLGANNAGKTSLLDCLSLEVAHEPHRSLETIPAHGRQPAATRSSFSAEFQTTLEELQYFGGNPVYLPLGNPPPDPPVLQNALQSVKSVRLKWGHLEGNQRVSYAYCNPNITDAALPINDDFHLCATIDLAGEHTSVLGISGTRMADPTHRVLEGLRKKIYRFDAQRRPGHSAGPSGQMLLDRLAQNLPSCLAQWQLSDSSGYEHFCALVTRVFPAIKWVNAPLNPQNLYQIRCWPVAPGTRRDDLALPLSSMGAGIGNVMAMLYVAVTSRDPQLVLIDEPSVYLHPRALRELMSILASEGKQHQYLLTAHASDMLTAVRASTITILDFDGVVTTATQVGTKDLHTVRDSLSEVGIRMTDLHGKDRVMWVEGQTEERILPELLLPWACPELSAGTAVLRVEHTGSFNKKKMDPVEVAEVYERLSSSSALVPPMVCVLLDAEKLAVDRRKELIDKSAGKLRFLERRMIENYLLDADAVAAVLTELGETTTSRDIIQPLISRALEDQNLDEVDGAQVLAEVFSTITEARQEFRKTRDVPGLVEWLVEHKAEALRPLKESLRRLFKLPVGDG